MGFGLSKSKGKSDLSVKRSKNKSLLTREAVSAIESEPKWKSVLATQQFTPDQRAEGETVGGPGLMYGKEVIMNVVDFEHGRSVSIWNSAKEPGRTQTADGYAGKFEVLVPNSNLLDRYDLSKIVRGSSGGKEQLEIRDLEEVKDWRTKEKTMHPELLKDHIAPSLSRKFDEGERSNDATERDGALIGATGDEGGSYENAMQSAAATYPVPQMIPRTVTVGYVTAGYLGVGESSSLPKGNGLPDIECVAKGDSLAKSADKSVKIPSQTRVEVRSKDDGPDGGAAVPEKFAAEGGGMIGGKGHSDVEGKDVPGCWADASGYLCTCSDSCPAKADCGGDFIVGFAHDYGRRDYAVSTAGKKLDHAVNVRDYLDEENASFIKKSLEEIGLIPLCPTAGPVQGDSSAVGKLSELARLQMERDALPPIVESRAEPQDNIRELQDDEETARPYECPESADADQANDGGENEIELTDVEAEEDSRDQEDDLSTVEPIQNQSGVNSLATGDLDSNESCPKWSDVDDKWNESEAIGGPQTVRGDESMFGQEENDAFAPSNNFEQDI